jgi:hypothetical protein
MTDPKRNLQETIDRAAMPPEPHTPPPKPASTGAVVLSTVKVVTTPALVFSIVTSMIKEKLHLQETDTTELEKQLKYYFTEVGIETESTLAVMTDRSHWHLPSELADTANDTNLIKIPILLTLCEIAVSIRGFKCFQMFAFKRSKFDAIKLMRREAILPR